MTDVAPSGRGGLHGRQSSRAGRVESDQHRRGGTAEGFVHGVGTLIEPVRQVRGESPNQVKDPHYSLVIGGPYPPLQSTALFSPKPLGP